MIAHQEFTSATNGSVYPITSDGFFKFQSDMKEAKAFEYEEMQQRVDKELRDELVRTKDERDFLRNRLAALKALDEKFMIVRN